MARDIDLLETAAKGLAYTKRPGFGSHSLLAPNGVMFAAVAGVGRLAVKVPDAPMAAELRARGAAPWEYSRTMEGWFLLPRDMLAAPEQLREWVRRAHALALSTPEKAKAAIVAEDSARAAPASEAAPAKQARKAPAKRAAPPQEVAPAPEAEPAPQKPPAPEPAAAPSLSPSASPRPGPAKRAKKAAKAPKAAKSPKVAPPKKSAKRAAAPAAPARKAGAKKAAGKKARSK